MLPCVFDQLWKVENKYMMLVVSLLIALMQDQAKAITAVGIAFVCITDKEAAISTELEKKFFFKCRISNNFHLS